MSEPVIDLLEDVWALDHRPRAEQLSEAEWKRPTDLPGWTVQDNLSHIIGTERMMRGEPAPEVTPVETAHLRNPIGEMNELWVESRRRHERAPRCWPSSEPRAAERLAEYRAMTHEQLDAVGPTPVGMAPFREFIAVRVMDSLGPRAGHAPRRRPPRPPRRARPSISPSGG